MEINNKEGNGELLTDLRQVTQGKSKAHIVGNTWEMCKLFSYFNKYKR